MRVRHTRGICIWMEFGARHLSTKHKLFDVSFGSCGCDAQDVVRVEEFQLQASDEMHRYRVEDDI